MNNFSVKITKRVAEAEDIISIELQSADGSPLPAFHAGAHIDVVISSGNGGAMTRQYSLCNSPSERHRYVIGVLRDSQSRGGSIAVHERFSEGDIVQISAPKNLFALAPAKRSLLLAGGIGVTPLLSMAEQLTQAGAEFEMHYCTRSAARTAFRPRIAASAFSHRVRFHADDGPPEQRFDLEALLAHPDDGTHIYVCGPSGFIDAAIGVARRSGWSDAQLHVERFGATLPHGANDDHFEVKIASTGQVYAIPANKSIAAALAEKGIAIPLSCEQGVCGTCITRVLDGIPDHRDEYFTEEERARNDYVMPCCSRSKSKSLVLDL